MGRAAAAALHCFLQDLSSPPSGKQSVGLLEEEEAAAAAAPAAGVKPEGLRLCKNPYTYIMIYDNNRGRRPFRT